MDIRCGNCSKLFRVADEKISGKGIRFKCSKCGEVITVTKQDLEMDLLAREGGEEGHPFRQEAAAPPKSPAQPPPPVPPVPPAPAAPPAEPEAREYKPPPPSPEDEEPVAQEYKPPEAPSAGLEDFDFSSPDVAAQHAQEPGTGLGDFSLGDMPEVEQQEAAGELSLSEEDAKAAEEDAFSFPVDMISEPKRKAAFVSPSGEQQEPAAGEMPLGEPEPGAAGAEAMPQDALGSEPVPDLGEPSEPEPERAPAPEPEPPAPEPPAEPEPKPEPAPPKGPVISPELLAQMKKASASRAAAAKQEPARAAASDEIDLGAALAIPKGAGEEPAHESGPTGALTGAAVGVSAGTSGKRLLVIGIIAVVLVAVLAALYFLGFLWGKRGQIARQAIQQVKQEFSPEGLSIADPVAYVDPEKGDLVITGKVQNSLDRTKPGWYLVINVTDGSEKVVATVRMVNGIQLLTKRDHAILAKRGVTVDAAAMTRAAQTAAIPARGSVTFEARLYEPPAGIAGFLPVLKTFDPEAMLKEAVQDATR